MIVSHNEITTTVRQAFEALGLGQGQGEDAAAMVAWRELHGLPAVEPLVAQVRARHPVREKPVKLLEATGEVAVFDGRGRSVLLSGPGVVDWAYTAAIQRGVTRVVLNDCLEPALLMGYLVRCAGRGVWGQLRWGLVTGHQGVFAVGPEGHPVYGYDERQPPALLASHQLEVTIFDERPEELSSPEFTEVIAAAEFLRRRRQREANGIAITAEGWNYLKEIGRGVLVPASEASRKGAGE